MTLFGSLDDVDLNSSSRLPVVSDIKSKSFVCYPTWYSSVTPAPWGTGGPVPPHCPASQGHSRNNEMSGRPIGFKQLCGYCFYFMCVEIIVDLCTTTNTRTFMMTKCHMKQTLDLTVKFGEEGRKEKGKEERGEEGKGGGGETGLLAL